MTDQVQRQAWLSLLAKAPAVRLGELFASLPDVPEHSWLRPPESGGVMVRGRMGGTGAPFNLGEMTVTRCSLQLAEGAVGHAYVQGRDKQKAERVAVLDALLQGNRADEVSQAVLEPLKQEMADAKISRAAKAASTKVDFFTMVRGED